MPPKKKPVKTESKKKTETKTESKKKSVKTETKTARESIEDDDDITAEDIKNLTIDKSNDSDEDSDDDNLDPGDADEDIIGVTHLSDDENEEDEAVFTFKEPIRGEREIVVIKNDNRITSDLMTKEEMTEAISERVRQLEKESLSFIDVGELSDPVSIAKKEMNMKKCPLILRRKIGSIMNNTTGKLIEYYEYWDVNEMEHRIIYDV